MREETSLDEVLVIRMSSTYIRTKRVKSLSIFINKEESLFVGVKPKDNRVELSFWP